MTEKKMTTKPVFKKVDKKPTDKKEVLKINSDKKEVLKIDSDKKEVLKIKSDKKPFVKENFVKQQPAEKKVEVKEISEKQIKIAKKEPAVKTLDKQNRAYATGKRKNAIAKVWLKKGSGNITINNVQADEYLKRDILMTMINTPFVVTETEGKYDVICSALGGGLSGQAGAIRLGISKALLIFNSEVYRKQLKQNGFLTRDSRIVERKKPGLKKARKGQVFTKR